MTAVIGPSFVIDRVFDKVHDDEPWGEDLMRRSGSVGNRIDVGEERIASDNLTY